MQQIDTLPIRNHHSRIQCKPPPYSLLVVKPFLVASLLDPNSLEAQHAFPTSTSLRTQALSFVLRTTLATLWTRCWVHEADFHLFSCQALVESNELPQKPEPVKEEEEPKEEE